MVTPTSHELVMNYLPLPSPDTTEESFPAVYCGIVTLSKVLQRAGRAFHSKYEKATESEAPKQKYTPSNVQDKGEASDRSKKNGKGTKESKTFSTKLKKLLQGPNLYDVLKVEEYCNMDSIRKSYRKLVLEFHPDKQPSKNGLAKQSGQPLSPGNIANKNDEFLLIQDAYEILSDPVSRRKYDSALPFDDSIPAASEVDRSNEESFFQVFCPVFSRNSKWAVKKPAPQLGSLGTDVKLVYSFYDYWRNFSSNRDFSSHCEYDIREAECREERRWLERKNQKTIAKCAVAEKARIKSLVELAYSLDPRVLKDTEKSKPLKQEQRNSVKLRQAEKLRLAQDLERKKKEEQESLRKSEEAFKRLEIEKRHELKAALKLTRKNIREICSEAVEKNLLCFEKVNSYCLGNGTDALSTLLRDFNEVSENEKRDAVKVAEIFEKAYMRWDTESKKKDSKECIALQSTGVAENALNASETERILAKAQEVHWTPEEVFLLCKGIQKYPGGTPRRWELIAGILKRRPVEAIIQKAKALAEAGDLELLNSSMNKEAFKRYLQENHGVMSELNVNPDHRDDMNGTLEAQEPISKWTPQQQKNLETALRAVPKTVPPKDRWTRIAECVPGKSPKECFARYKEVHSFIMASMTRANSSR